MISHPAFAVEPWVLRERELDLGVLGQSESLFALGNGHIGLRGNLDEGEPSGITGSYLAGFYEHHDLPQAEPGYGYPEAGQTIVNVTDGKIIRLLVDDQPFDVRFGDLEEHERVLDLRRGLLERTVVWRSPAGKRVRVRSLRLVSLAQRAVAAISYEVSALEEPLGVVLQSELIANEAPPGQEPDPRAARSLAAPLEGERSWNREARALLVHRTRLSGLRVAVAMDHEVEAPDGTERESESEEDLARYTVSADLAPGERLRVVKLLAYGWSSRRSAEALGDQVMAALAGARHSGWDGLASQQEEYLREFWARADVELEGESRLQQAVRFGLFHTMQAGARGEQRAIAAKGLTGPGYDGHTFWDTETFVLPVLTYTVPEGARDSLRWRQATLGLARERARVLGLRGAAFPWRTIDGQECSGYWPAGTAAFHIAADIADAVARYEAASGDEDFQRETGLELLVETARLWRSLGHHDARGDFRIDGVTGPDEYSALADNNIYTNLMAQRNLQLAADRATRHPQLAAELKVDQEEIASWREAAREMRVPFDQRLGVHPQAEGFTEHELWDFEGTAPDGYPLLLHFPYFDLYRKQVVKQADLVLALHLRGDAFTAEEKARNFAYYEAMTVRDSSLSAGTQAVIAAEVGHMNLAFDYFREAALMDLENLEHNTRDGLHIASLANSWNVAVAGFGGMRDHEGQLSFAPRLPERITRLAFHLLFQGRLLRVEITPEEARYSLREGPALGISHHGQRIRVAPDQPAICPIPPLRPLEAPRQPVGRPPRRPTSPEAEVRPEGGLEHPHEGGLEDPRDAAGEDSGAGREEAAEDYREGDSEGPTEDPEQLDAEHH